MAERSSESLTPSEPTRPRRTATWRVLIENRVRRLSEELDRITPPRVGQSERDAEIARGAIQEARDEVARPLSVRERAANWWTGGIIERAWSSLHAAEQALIMAHDNAVVRARLPDIKASVRASIRKADPRRDEFLDTLKKLAGSKEPPDRYILRSILAAAHTASDVAFSNLRNFRNILLVVTALLFVFVLVLAFDPPSFLPICIDEDCPEVWQVELVGALGGVLAAVVAVRKLDGFRGPYDLPLVQAILKVPAGAVTGLFGAMLIQNKFLDAFTPQPGTKLLVYVAVFGYAQEALTTFVDTQADKILGAARPVSDPAKDVSDGK